MHPSRWLVVSNCQAFGIANCLRLLSADEVDITCFALPEWRQRKDEFLADQKQVARVFVSPDAAPEVISNLSSDVLKHIVPHDSFRRLPP
jgi:hypothetical protein